VLKTTGVLLLGTSALAPASAVLRSSFDSWCARVRPDVRPRYLTLPDVERLLEPRFVIEAGWNVHRNADALLPSLQCETWAFVCRPRPVPRNHQSQERSFTRVADVGSPAATWDKLSAGHCSPRT
jgi:hypothetical protein